jgi:IS5 family transposase
MQKSFSDLEYAAKKKLTRRDRFLAEIDKVTPWSQLHQLIAPFYPKAEGAGRPPIGMARMLRMYVAQQCFGLSDEGIEDAIYDSQAIRGLVGIDLNRESPPDATTLLKFRRLLEKTGGTWTSSTAVRGHWRWNTSRSAQAACLPTTPCQHGPDCASFRDLQARGG